MLFAAFVISLEWLETYSVEGWGSAGTNKRLKYAKEQQQQGAGYRERVLDNIEKWISIPTHSFAAQSILISGYQDVYVEIQSGHPSLRIYFLSCGTVGKSFIGG